MPTFSRSKAKTQNKKRNVLWPLVCNTVQKRASSSEAEVLAYLGSDREQTECPDIGRLDGKNKSIYKYTFGAAWSLPDYNFCCFMWHMGLPLEDWLSIGTQNTGASFLNACHPSQLLYLRVQIFTCEHSQMHLSTCKSLQNHSQLFSKKLRSTRRCLRVLVIPFASV